MHDAGRLCRHQGENSRKATLDVLFQSKDRLYPWFVTGAVVAALLCAAAVGVVIFLHCKCHHESRAGIGLLLLEDDRSALPYKDDEASEWCPSR